MNNPPNNQKLLKGFLPILILACLSFTSAQGQFQKKTIMAGGDINIPILSENQDGSKHYHFNPKIGYFLFNNFALGLNIESSLFTLDGSRRTELGAGPMVRYYYKMNRIYGFAHFSYLANFVTFNTAELIIYESIIEPGIGIGYMLSPSVGIDAIFAYNLFRSNDTYAEIQKSRSSAIGIALQIYFPPN